MNNSRRRLLTEYLGECWHEWEGGIELGKSHYDCKPEKCKHCGVSKYSLPTEMMPRNRTFTEPADFFALFRKMEEKGDWNEVCEILIRKWSKVNDYRTVYDFTERFTAYLLSDIERFCSLVGEWLEEQKGG